MRLRGITIFIIMMFTFYACQEVIDQSDDDNTDKKKIIQQPGLIQDLYTGFDIDGNERTCQDNDSMACTEIFIDSDQYALDCQRSGDLAIQCGCHDWICVDKNSLINGPTKITGRDISGNIDSCEPFDYRVDGQDVACTLQFTEEDQFAADCQANGYEAVQCGCHKFLCLE